MGRMPASTTGSTSLTATRRWIRGAALAKDPTSAYAKIGAEFLQFIDTDRSAGSSHILLKSVIDATVIDIPTV